MANLALRSTAQTHLGLRRSNNQDSGYASDRMLIVADGMGGAAAGDLASAEALTVLRTVDADLDTDALSALHDAVQQANSRLATLIDHDPAVEGMGTTVEAMLFDGTKFAMAHIGDSRTYRLRDGALAQLSIDHTFVQSLVDEGRLSPAEAREHPHRSLLLRALLGRDDNEAEMSWLQPQLGDRYLLCSDGLTDMVLDETIEQVLKAGTIEEAADELVRLALAGGGVDNVTVVIGEMIDRNAAAAPAIAEDGTESTSTLATPIVIGAAAEPRRRKTPKRSGGQAHRLRPIDPEEARYAPRAPGHSRLTRLLAGIAAVLTVTALVGYLGYRWTQTRYFIADHDGKVTIFQGVNAHLPGLTLQHVDDVSTINLVDLTPYERSQVRQGIDAASRADAEDIIDKLGKESAATPPPTTPGPTMPTPTTPTGATATPSKSAT